MKSSNALGLQSILKTNMTPVINKKSKSERWRRKKYWPKFNKQNNQI